MNWWTLLFTVSLLVLVSMKLFNKLFGNNSPRGIPQGEKALLDALAQDDIENFKKIFQTHKFNPNYVTYTKKSILQLCISYKHSLPFIEYLLSLPGIDVDFVHANGRSAVFEAAYLGAYQQVERLIQAGADISKHYPDMFDFSCLDAACYRRKYDIVFLLLQHGRTTQEIRDRHQHYVVTLPKDNVRLIDERIERIMDYFDVYLPRQLSLSLAGILQREHKTPVGKHPTLLQGLVKEHFRDIELHYNKVEGGIHEGKETDVLVTKLQGNKDAGKGDANGGNASKGTIEINAN